MSDTNFDYKKYLDNNPLLTEADTTPKEGVKEKKEVKEDDGMDRTDALRKLKDILEDLKYFSKDANELLSMYFPDAHTQAEAYGALDFGTSSNKYDTTLEKIIDGIERGIYMD